MKSIMSIPCLPRLTKKDLKRSPQPLYPHRPHSPTVTIHTYCCSSSASSDTSSNGPPSPPPMSAALLGYDALPSVVTNGDDLDPCIDPYKPRSSSLCVGSNGSGSFFDGMDDNLEHPWYPGIPLREHSQYIAHFTTSRHSHPLSPCTTQDTVQVSFDTPLPRRPDSKSSRAFDRSTKSNRQTSAQTTPSRRQ